MNYKMESWFCLKIRSYKKKINTEVMGLKLNVDFFLKFRVHKQKQLFIIMSHFSNMTE